MKTVSQGLAGAIWVATLWGLLMTSSMAWAEEPSEPAAEAFEERQGQLDRERDTIRRDLSTMTDEELREAGFVFEDTLSDRSRAHATIFALFAGSVVHGAGHWQLEDSRTALSLLALELIGLSMLGTGMVLGVRGTGIAEVDARRRELWFLGAGLLGTSWLVDIFGTAYRDDLGIPPSTANHVGVGGALRYDYWRPAGLSMRHVATAELYGRTRHLHVEGRTSQELGYGMSNYEVRGRWYPVVGFSPETRFGIEAHGAYLQYRLDDPFERLDARLLATSSLNLGRLYQHLDQMTVGLDLGVGVRGYRLPDGLGEWSPMSYSGWYLPMRMFMALNLTSQLRFQASFERGMGSWLQRSRGRIGVPELALTYRSTENLQLLFALRGGNGVGIGLGLKLWFGE